MRAAWQVGVGEVPLAGMDTENSPHSQTRKTSDEAPSHPGNMLKYKWYSKFERIILSF